MEDRPMWIMLMFDLPVLTKPQRKAASRFRADLLSDGFQMIQLSVYARFCPTIQRAKRSGDVALSRLPDLGHCRVLYLTDHQWHRMIVIRHQKPVGPEPEPAQLTIFGASEDLESPANQAVHRASEV